MTLSPLLPLRVPERDALLKRLTAALLADDRFVAAWLYGSLGRGTEDAVSDLDVWVVVQDKSLPALLQDGYAFAALVAEPLFVLEAPYNGPLGGTSLNTAYDGAQTGAHLVDWYLQGASTACRPPHRRLLFDRIGLPACEVETTGGNPDVVRSETAGKVQDIRFFWQMLLICAKYVYRSPNEERMGLLVYAVNALNHVREFLGQPIGPTVEELPPHPTPAEKLTLLQTLADTMVGFMPEVEQIAQVQGETWQISPTLIPSAYRFLNFIEDALSTAEI